jgi:hypothetical protein
MCFCSCWKCKVCKGFDYNRLRLGRRVMMVLMCVCVCVYRRIEWNGWLWGEYYHVNMPDFWYIVSFISLWTEPTPTPDRLLVVGARWRRPVWTNSNQVWTSENLRFSNQVRTELRTWLVVLIPVRTTPFGNLNFFLKSWELGRVSLNTLFGFQL